MSRKSAVIELVPEVQAPNGTHGWRPQVSTRRVTADPEQFPKLAAPDGVEPFWAEIRDDLTFAEAERIPFEASTTFAEQWAVIAPMVLAWNATAYDPTTNTWEAVPPPADAGPDVFKTQVKYVTTFLVLCLKYNADLNLPKGPKRSDATGAG